jgi:hypothetical protein
MAQLLDRVLHLRRRQLGKLHRGRRQRHKAIRVLFAPRSKTLIRSVHDFVCQRPVFHRVPPVPVDAQRLNVDPAPVELADAICI